MVASNARAVLQKENEFLDQLIKASPTSTQGLTGVEADIINGWVNYFKEWRKINEECIGMTDARLAAHLDSETKRLRRFVSSITSTTTGAKFHKKSFDADFKIAEKLLT
jgi:hypothetical protein